MPLLMRNHSFQPVSSKPKLHEAKWCACNAEQECWHDGSHVSSGQSMMARNIEPKRTKINIVACICAYVYIYIYAYTYTSVFSIYIYTHMYCVCVT